MQSSTTRLVVCLGLVGVAFGQFLGPRGRPHPIHSRRAQDFTNMITMASLFGFDMSDLLMWNAFGGGGELMMNPVPVNRALGPPRQLERTLTLLGVIDGADAPDPVAPAAPGARGKKRGKGAGGGGGGGGGGEREGGPPPRGGGKGRLRGKKRGNKGPKKAGGGAGK